jgi:hypothetical protein
MLATVLLLACNAQVDRSPYSEALEAYNGESAILDRLKAELHAVRLEVSRLSDVVLNAEDFSKKMQVFPKSDQKLAKLVSESDAKAEAAKAEIQRLAGSRDELEKHIAEQQVIVIKAKVRLDGARK